MMDYRGYGQGGSSSSAHTGGFYYGVVKAVDGDTVTVQVPRLFGGAQIPGIPVVGVTPSVDDSVFISFIEGRRGALLAFPVEATTGDITAVAAGTNLNGGGTSGDVTLNLDDDISVTSVTGNLYGPSHISVKNTSGGALAKGTAVYATGSVGASGAVEVQASDNTNSSTMPALGLLDEALNNGDTGSATIFGVIRQVDTSSYAINDELWINGSGTLQNTRPTSGLIQKIGRVVRVHATTGEILVMGAGRTNDVPFPLFADHANQRVGIGTTSPTKSLHVYDAYVDQMARFESGDTRGGIQVADNATTQSVALTAVGDDMRLMTNNTDRVAIDSAGLVGIGTTSPNVPLHLNIGTDNVAILAQSTDATCRINMMDDSTTGNSYVGIGAVGNDLSLWAGNSKKMTVLSDGKVGIGTTSPTHELTVDGDISLPTDGSVWIGGTGNGIDRLRLHHASSTGHAYIDYRDDLYFRADGGGGAMVLDSTGKVGIGTTSPVSTLHIAATAPSIHIQDTNASSSTNGEIQWTGSGGAAIGKIDFDGTDDMRIYSAQQGAGTGYLYFNIGGNWEFRMDTAGFKPYSDNVNDCGSSGLRWDDVYATNGTIQTSDRRDKKDIVDLDLGLDFIRQLRPVSFVWDDRSGKAGTREHMGFIAQELEATLGSQASERAVWITTPAASAEGADGETIESPERQGIRYEELIAPLVAAVQEQAAQIEELQPLVATEQKQAALIEALEARIEALEAQ